jgi:uncharacterized membrane protein
MLANLALALFLLGIGFIGSLSGSELHVDVIPASPESMTTVLLLSGLAGLFSVILAIRPGRVSRIFLVLWSLLVTSILVCAFTRSSYRFDGEEHFRFVVLLFILSLGALLGAFLRWKLAPERSRT